MSAQVTGMFRNAMFIEIGRRRANYAIDRYNFARNQARVLEIGYAQGDVVAALHRIDLLVAEREVDPQLRIEGHEIGDGRAEF